MGYYDFDTEKENGPAPFRGTSPYFSITSKLKDQYLVCKAHSGGKGLDSSAALQIGWNFSRRSFSPFQ